MIIHIIKVVQLIGFTTGDFELAISEQVESQTCCRKGILR